MKDVSSDRPEIVFLAVVLTLSAGVPLALYSIYFFAESVETLAAIGVVALVIVAIAGILAAKYRKRIALRFFGAPLKVANSIAEPAAQAISNLAFGQSDKAEANIKDAARGLAAHYSWVQTRRWIIAAATGLLIGFAGIVGSALLKKQNDLILDQNRFFRQQIEQQQVQLELQQSVANQQVRSEAIRRIYGPEFQSTPRVKAEAVRSLVVVERARIASGDNTLATDYLNLHEADLRDAWLENSDLERVSFRGTNISGGNFSASSLSESVFRFTDFEGAAFVSSKLDQTLFAFCFGGASVFSGADLTGATFNQCDLAASTFSNANLSQASFLQVNLRDVDFQGVENWQTIVSIEGSNVFGIRNPPDGFEKWALTNGAVSEPNALSGLRQRAEEAKQFEEGAAD